MGVVRAQICSDVPKRACAIYRLMVISIHRLKDRPCLSDEKGDFKGAVSVCDSAFEEPQATAYVLKVAKKRDVKEGNNRIIVNQ